MRFIDRTGEIFGRLTVVKLADYKSGKELVWLCRCSCGNPNLHPVTYGNLKARTRSCGCLRDEVSSARFRTHGDSKTVEYQMFMHAKERAKAANVPIEITYKDILVPDTCPVLGIELVSNYNPRMYMSEKKQGKPRLIGKQTDNSPTLDRIIPNKGYVKGNIWVISQRANRIKNNATLDELESLVVAIRQIASLGILEIE